MLMLALGVAVAVGVLVAEIVGVAMGVLDEVRVTVAVGVGPELAPAPRKDAIETTPGPATLSLRAA